MKKFSRALCLSWILAGVLMCSVPCGAAESSGKSIESIIARFGSGKFGAHVVRISDGAVLVDHNGHEPLMPASNQKIVTSAVVAKRLGFGFKFETLVGMEGADLAVVGDLDPTAGDATIAQNQKADIYTVLDGWAEKLKAAGVKQVGKVILRTGIMTGSMYNPDWADRHRRQWYGAPVAGLNFNDNCLDMTFNVEGSKVQPVISPVDPFIQIDSKVTHGDKPVWNFQFTSDDGTALSLTGTMTHTSKDPVFIPYPNPPILYGTVLADRLAKAGIEVKGPVEVSDQPKSSGFKLIASAQVPITAAMARANKQSLNMMAECMFLRAAATPGSPATWEKAAAVAKGVLVNDYKIDEKLVNVADGCGLSRTNTVAPAALTTILLALQNEPDFIDSLAIGGVDGTLERRFTKGPSHGRVVGKTGSLDGVSALSGYILDKSGKPAYAFSILVNGGGGKGMSPHDLQNSICEELIKASDTQK